MSEETLFDGFEMVNGEKVRKLKVRRTTVTEEETAVPESQLNIERNALLGKIDVLDQQRATALQRISDIEEELEEYNAFTPEVPEETPEEVPEETPEE